MQISATARRSLSAKGIASISADSAAVKVTPFQESVYNLICQIPSGKVMSYGTVSDLLQSSPRAVGGALKRNPFAPHVPCHRIVKTDRTLGGFHGETNQESELLTKKRRMLTEEGVMFDDDGKVSQESMYDGKDIVV